MLGVFFGALFSLSASEFCSQERWALADGDVGVEETWYFLGSYSCKQEHSSPLPGRCGRSSEPGEAWGKGTECSTGVFGMKNATFGERARLVVVPQLGSLPGARWSRVMLFPPWAAAGTSVQGPSVAFPGRWLQVWWCPGAV